MAAACVFAQTHNNIPTEGQIAARMVQAMVVNRSRLLRYVVTRDFHRNAVE
jgi:hypothetical protein